MTNDTNNDITYEDYETIRIWVENQEKDKTDVICSLLLTNPLPELASKYDAFEKKVVAIIKKYGEDYKLVTFDESIDYRDEIQLYVPAQNYTDEELLDEWVYCRDIDDLRDELHEMALEHEYVDVSKECVVRLKQRQPDEFVVLKKVA